MPTANFGLPLYTLSDTAELDVLLNGQSNAIDAALVSLEGYTIGTDAQRIALAAPRLKEGLEWYSTDTNRKWFYDGSNWVSAEQGMYLIQPTTVNNGVINADGSASPNASVTSFSLNGVFTTRFRAYKIVAFIRYQNVSAPGIYLRTAGVDNNSVQYQAGKVFSNAGAAPAAADFATSRIEPASNTALVHLFEMVITHPAHSTTGYWKTMIGTSGGLSPTYTCNFRSSFQVDTISFDGFTIFAYAGGGTQLLETLSWVKVYGLA